MFLKSNKADCVQQSQLWGAFLTRLVTRQTPTFGERSRQAGDDQRRSKWQNQISSAAMFPPLAACTSAFLSCLAPLFQLAAGQLAAAHRLTGPQSQDAQAPFCPRLILPSGGFSLCSDPAGRPSKGTTATSALQEQMRKCYC